MRNTIKILFVVGVTFFCMGCEDDMTDDVSFVTTYPELQLQGDEYMVVQQGEPFTDPGVIAKIGDEEVETTVSGLPDMGSPGIYIVNYSAENEDGFSRSVTRTVGVTSEDLSGSDVISGYYLRTDIYPSVIIQTGSPDAYYSTNGWGTSSIIPINFTITGTTISIPQQSTNFGPVLGTGTVDPGVSITFTMDIPNSGIAGSNRVHIKQ